MLRVLSLLLLALTARTATLDVCLSGCTYNLANADDSNPIQMAMNASACGDVIEIRPGETHEVAIILPIRSCASNPIRVTTARRAEIPTKGKRVNPADHAQLMPTLVPLVNSNALISTNQLQQTIASVNTATDVMTFAAPHGMSDNDPVSCRSYTVTSPGLPTGLTQNVVYYVKSSTATEMQYSVTPGGAAIDLSGTLSGAGNYCTKAIATSGWIFDGLNFTTKSGTIHLVELLSIGTGEESSYQGMPHHFEFRHNLISGRITQVTGPKKGLAITAAQYVTVEDNWISDARLEFYDSNAVYLGVASRHIKIRNNYLSAGSEVILSGGTGSGMLDAVVEDVTIEGNTIAFEAYMHRKTGTGAPPAEDCFYDTLTGIGAIYINTTGSPTDCAGGACYRCNASRAWVQDTASVFYSDAVPKGRIELKQGRKIRIEGNVIRNGPVGGDTGNPGTCAMIPSQVDHERGVPWSNGADIIFRNNICDDTWRFVQATSYGASLYTNQNKNILVENNLGINQARFPAMSKHAADSASYASAWAATDGCENCIFRKNTVRLAGTAISYSWGLHIETEQGGFTMPGYRFEDSIIPRYASATQVGGTGAGADCTSLSGFLPSLTPTPFNNYVMVGSGTNPFSGCSTNAAVESSIAFESDSSLTPGSKYSATCSLGGGCGYTNTDGTDLGGDIKKIRRATCGALTGTPCGISGVRLHVGSTNAAISWRSAASCTVKLYTDLPKATLHADTADSAKWVDSRAGSLVSGLDRTFVLGTIAALTASPRTDYYVDLECGSEIVPFEFKTRAAGTGRTVRVAYSTARTGQVTTADDPDFSDPFGSFGSATEHLFTLGSGSVVWYRETGGKPRVFVEP